MLKIMITAKPLTRSNVQSSTLDGKMSTNVPSGAPRPFSEVKTIKVALHHTVLIL
jgi:hypothetical protein